MRTMLYCLATMCCLSLFTCPAEAENTDISAVKNVLYINPDTLKQGTTEHVISVKMKNELGSDGYAIAQGFTFYLRLPEGFTFANDENGNLDVRVSNLRTSSEQLDVFRPRVEDDGRLYVLAGTQEGDGYITGKDGEVVQVHISLPQNADIGEYPIRIESPGISPSTGGSQIREIDAVETTLTIEPADTRIVTIADITDLIAQYLAPGSDITINDITTLIEEYVRSTASI